MACEKPYTDLSTLNFDRIDYEHPSLSRDDMVLSTFDLEGLECPDGSPARVIALYPTEVPGAMPVAIVYHSGAFDYVLEPDPSGYINGPHYHAQSRLSQPWSVAKVWETLGLYNEEIDAYEANLGELPAALANLGFVQIYPANCWGDLWHNETGVQDSQSQIEGFERNGRTIAFWMVENILEPSKAGQRGISVPVQLDPLRIHLVGLGDGGRAVAEVLAHENLPDIAGALVDSSPDLLSAYVENEAAYEEEVAGLSMIFGEEQLSTIDAFSLNALPTLPPSMGFVWSSGDPRQPAAASAGTAARVAAEGGWSLDVASPSHVQLNADADLAAAAAEYLLHGTIPAN
jgi:hypothetical protein